VIANLDTFLPNAEVSVHMFVAFDGRRQDKLMMRDALLGVCAPAGMRTEV